MKKLFLSLTIIAALFLIACSKDGGGGGGNANGNNNVYGTTPSDSRCGNGAHQGFHYNQPGYQQGGFYGNQYYGNIPSNVNCIPSGAMYGGNPYYFQANYQVFLGLCDLRFSGRTQLCPVGYQCQPTFGFGTLGVCMRGY